MRARAAVVTFLLLACWSGSSAWRGAAAEAAPLAEIRERGTLSVCAHPDALPYSSQDRLLPGFQLELADAIAKQLGVRLHVDWIVFTRHARRVECDATIGSIVKDDDGGGTRRGPRLTRHYIASGYVLVVPAASPPIQHLEDLKGGKIGVEHTSWPHYVLDSRKIPFASYGGPVEIMDAVARHEVAAGLVSDAYAGWYLKLNPGAVKISETYVPEKDFRWNVAVALRNADTALVDAVNKALDTLTADKTIATVLGRYGITYRPPITR
jgi:polar amino acid transport system substrate-binding protein